MPSIKITLAVFVFRKCPSRLASEILYWMILDKATTQGDLTVSCPCVNSFILSHVHSYFQLTTRRVIKGLCSFPSSREQNLYSLMSCSER